MISLQIRKLPSRLKAKVQHFCCFRLENLLIRVIRHFTIRQPLKNVILIESHDDFDCNGGALYSYLLRHHYHETYRIVWLLKHPAPKKLPKNVRAYSISRPSIMKAYYRCTAKILTADNVVTPKVRADQKEYYLTHGGITFKNVRGLLVVPEHVDYVLSASANYDPYVCRNYSIPYPNQKMLHFGYPRDDVFYTETPDEIRKLSKKHYDKVFLWMPTFRKLTGTDRNDSTAEQPLGIPLIADPETFQQLNAYLRAHHALLVLKLHPGQDLSCVKVTDCSNIRIVTQQTMHTRGLDLARLMKSADALISDYSSAAYTYLLLDRPIGFILSDLKDYKLGFCVENYEDFLPGEQINSYDDMLAFLEHVLCGADPHHAERLALRDFLYAHQDGNACRRLVEFMGL